MGFSSLSRVEHVPKSVLKQDKCIACDPVFHPKLDIGTNQIKSLIQFCLDDRHHNKNTWRVYQHETRKCIIPSVCSKILRLQRFRISASEKQAPPFRTVHSLHNSGRNI
jgi:hypothetical protein